MFYVIMMLQTGIVIKFTKKCNNPDFFCFVVFELHEGGVLDAPNKCLFILFFRFLMNSDF